MLLKDLSYLPFASQVSVSWFKGASATFRKHKNTNFETFHANLTLSASIKHPFKGLICGRAKLRQILVYKTKSVTCIANTALFLNFMVLWYIKLFFLSTHIQCSILFNESMLYKSISNHRTHTGKGLFLPAPQILPCPSRYTLQHISDARREPRLLSQTSHSNNWQEQRDVSLLLDFQKFD